MLDKCTSYFYYFYNKITDQDNLTNKHFDLPSDRIVPQGQKVWLK